MSKVKFSTIVAPLVITLALVIGLVLIAKNIFAAPKTSAESIKYRISSTAKQSAITGDLKYYGFIKHESTLNLALYLEGKIFLG